MMFASTYELKTRLTIRATAAVVVIGGLIAVPSDADAATNSPTVPGPGYQSSNAQSRLDPRQVRSLTALGKATNGRAFNANEARNGGATEADITSYVGVVTAYGFTITGDFIAPTTSMIMALRGCVGRSGIRGYYIPWGRQYALNSCQTSQLMGYVGAGATAAGGILGIFAAMGGPAGAITAGAVGAIIAFGWTGLQLCQNASPKHAIYINLGGAPAVSCWGQ
jgi:hypothetical protein